MIETIMSVLLMVYVLGAMVVFGFAGYLIFRIMRKMMKEEMF